MFLLHILFTILMRPSVMIFGGLLIAAAVALVYFSGPKALLRWVTDARVWLVVGAFACILAISDLSKQNAKLSDRVAASELLLTGKEDAKQTIVKREKQRAVRTQQSDTIRQATEAASHEDPTQVVDRTLDAIEQVQAGGLDGRAPAPQPVPDGVRVGKAPDGHVAP